MLVADASCQYTNLVGVSDDVSSMCGRRRVRSNSSATETAYARLTRADQYQCPLQESSDEQELKQLHLFPSRRTAAQAVLTAAFALHSLPGFAVAVCTN